MADPINEIPTIDYNLSLYDLTDLFFSYFRYHNDSTALDYNEIAFSRNPETNTLQPNIRQISLSRFAVLRRIKACLLSSRPFIGNVENAPQKPNVNMGYLAMLMRYVSLPFKSVTSEPELVKINIDRKLRESTTLSERTKVKRKLEAQDNPNIFSNGRISEDTSKCFNFLLSQSKCMQETARRMATEIPLNAFSANLHIDPEWPTEPIDALDFVFEPQAYWDTSTWSNFFIIRKMPAQEAVRIIKENRHGWNIDALRWALENSQLGRSIFRTTYNQAGYTSLGTDNTPLCGENFMVKSFYQDKSLRSLNLQGYYGNLLIVEAYYMNTDGNVQKTIFFPSSDFLNISRSTRDTRKLFTPQQLEDEGLKNADVLFTRTLRGKKSIRDILTVIPFDRAEPTLERQRAYGHECFNPVEMLMRVDSAILNIVGLMSVIYYRNRNEGASAQTLQELEIKMDGTVQDIGDRDFIDQPLTHDLNAMLAVRNMLLQWAMQKAYLSGLDNMEAQGAGRGADFAKYRLIRDGRIHKHDIEDFGKGQEELYAKVLRSVLEEMARPVSVQDKDIRYLFTTPLIDEYGYEKKLFEFDQDEVLDDTGLPYWMSVTALRNGASHMGAAEMVVYSEIKQLYGESLGKIQLDALNYKGIKSLLGPQDAEDILGDPREQANTNADQIHEAQIENAAILGSVSNGVLNFEAVGVRETKDDPIAHLAEVHNPKCEEIIKMLEEADVTPADLEGMTENQLDTRVNLILRLAALTNHTSLHMQQLEFFGSEREDVNALKEQTNAIIQSSEGLLNNLQLSLRALQAKRQDKELRLQNLSPENDAEKMKQQTEMMKLQAERERDQGKLMLANKIADQQQKQHMDKQLTAARDRAQKDRQAKFDAQIKAQEAQANSAVKFQESNANIQNKFRESDFNMGLKQRENQVTLGTKAREAALNAGIKAGEAQTNIALKKKESDAKIEMQKKESAAKAEALRKSGANGASSSK